MSICMNTVYLGGKVVTTPLFNHVCRGRMFANFSISVLRYSGTCDVIPVIMPRDYLLPFGLKIGDYVLVKGEYRSYNNDDGTLMLYLHGKELEVRDDTFFYNSVEMEGYICKRKAPRITPLGKVIMDVMLGVNRRFSKSSYIPCIIWNISNYEAERLNIGDKLYISGRIQSRDYNKFYEEIGSIKTKTAYEISVRKYEKIFD